VGALTQLIGPLMVINSSLGQMTLVFAYGNLFKAQKRNLYFLLTLSQKENHLALKFYSGHRANIFSTKFLPFQNDNLVISCAGDCQVRAFYLHQQEEGMVTPYFVSKHHNERVKKLAFFNDSSFTFLSASEDCTSLLFDLRTTNRSPLKVIDLAQGNRTDAVELTSVAISGNYIAVGGRKRFSDYYED